MTIYVTGHRGSGYSYGSYGFSFSMMGGDGGDTSGREEERERDRLQEFSDHEQGRVPAKPTPCVKKAPLAGNLNDINEHAKYLEGKLLGIRDGNEWGSIVWTRDDLGSGKTPLFTSNNPNGVTISYDAIPTGATIVAIIHNHPDRNAPEDQLPSPGDRTAYDNVMFDGDQVNPRFNFYTDPNLLMYIVDENTGTTNVYDRDTVKANIVTCSI